MTPTSPTLSSTSGMPARLALLLTAVLTAFIFTPIIWRMSNGAYDYIVHTNLAIKMLASRTLPSPHFLLQACIIMVQKILSVSFNTATALVVLISIVGTAILLFKIMNVASQSPRVAAALTTGLLLTAQIPLFAPLDRHLYFGYIATNVYHNPTILLLKPFALIVFGFAFTRPGEDVATTWKTLTACILATIACTLAKPSYIIVLLPALLIAASLPSMRKILCTRAWLISMGILLPALIMLAGQYWYTYSTEQLPGVYAGKSSIIFAPLVVVSYFSSWLLLKFFLSIAFPLAVTAAYFRKAIACPRLLFAWLAFVIGATYNYLLAESGPRMFQGNFAWSGQITLFILFAVSMEFLWNNKAEQLVPAKPCSKKFMICMAIFALHVASGILFYLAGYITNDKFW